MSGVPNPQRDFVAGCCVLTRSILHCVVNDLHGMPPEEGRNSPGSGELPSTTFLMIVGYALLSFSVLWLIFFLIVASGLVV